MKRPNKGEFDYPSCQRKFVLLRTAVYFLMSAAVFLLGYFSTGKKENLLTIVAVLGLLPSSKSLVSAVMYMKIPDFSQEVYQEISQRAGGLQVLYSMYLTSYRLNYPVSCFAIRGGSLIGYTEFKGCDTSACEGHIQGILKQNGIKNVTVRIFGDRARFVDRLDQIREFEPGKKETEVLALLCDISL